MSFAKLITRGRNTVSYHIEPELQHEDAAGQRHDDHPLSTFRDALAQHLRAIRERDLDALRETLPRDEVVLVTATGNLHTDVDDFVQMHRDWFSSSTWTLDMVLLHARERHDLATALLRLDYHDVTAEGTAFHEQSILSLIFERQHGRWVMVQDQNTPIRAQG